LAIVGAKYKTVLCFYLFGVAFGRRSFFVKTFSEPINLELEQTVFLSKRLFSSSQRLFVASSRWSLACLSLTSVGKTVWVLSP